MKTLLRRLLGQSKRELREELASVCKTNNLLAVKAIEGDTLLSAEIDRLNDELDALNHKFAPVKFENDRLVGENATLKAHLDIGARNGKLLADEKERLRLTVVELHENIERLEDRLEQQADAYAAKNEEIRREWDKVVAPLRDQIRSLADQLAAVNIEKTEAEQEADGLNGYFDNIDNQISGALEQIGSFPPRPAGAADRIDVICDRVVSLHAELNAVVATASETHAELKARLADANASIDHEVKLKWAAIEERDRLHRMLTEPEFLRMESERVGDIVTTSADLKHWAARVMVQSFADSLDGDRAVELAFGDEEHGQFLVTIKQDDGRSLCDEVRTLEIALEASAELEKKWKRQRRRLRAEVDRFQKYDRESRVRAAELRTETEHVKNTCASLRERCDNLAHALIGLTEAVAKMKVGHPIPARDQIARLVRLERAVAEADRVLGSEPSAA